MSIALTFRDTVSAVETVSDVFASSTDATVTHALNTSRDLTGATAIPVTKQASGQATMSGGALTLDLTALTGYGTGGATVNATGLKLQVAKFRAKKENSAIISVTPGATNPYNFITSGGSIPLDADGTYGQAVTLDLAEMSPEVAVGAKTIDISGTGTDVLEFVLVFG